jgi:hypothetical protein
MGENAMTVLDEPKKPGLTDVSRIPLRELMSRISDPLDEAIRRVTTDAENESLKSVSAFNSAI